MVKFSPIEQIIVQTSRYKAQYCIKSSIKKIIKLLTVLNNE